MPDPTLFVAQRAFGHDRDGVECVAEVCGGSPSAACDHPPAEVARLEERALFDFNSDTFKLVLDSMGQGSSL